jgi:hypothetical protein
MARIIQLDIDVKKLRKDRMKVTDKGIYAKITLIETPDGKYGQWMAVETQTKEEREAKEKGNILGNGKNFNWGESSPSTNRATTESSDDLPF